MRPRSANWPVAPTGCGSRLVRLNRGQLQGWGHGWDTHSERQAGRVWGLSKRLHDEKEPAETPASPPTVHFFASCAMVHLDSTVVAAPYPQHTHTHTQRPAVTRSCTPISDPTAREEWAAPREPPRRSQCRGPAPRTRSTACPARLPSSAAAPTRTSLGQVKTGRHAAARARCVVLHSAAIGQAPPRRSGLASAAARLALNVSSGFCIG